MYQLSQGLVRFTQCNYEPTFELKKWIKIIKIILSNEMPAVWELCLTYISGSLLHDDVESA